MFSPLRLCTFRSLLFDLPTHDICSYLAPLPAFRQPTPKTNVPKPSPVPPTHQDTPLDHSLVGMSGGEIFHEMMRRHDVKQMFGYPGGAIFPVIDAIRDSKYFKFVLPRHEQGAGHMAEGYARVSGKPGVVLVTSGPGATNVVTPRHAATRCVQ